MGNKLEEIMLLPEDPDPYADPHNVNDLPFPSANLVPARFSISNEGKISYMGRECFLRVWNALAGVRKDSQHRQAIYVYGGKGLGKSYILAALACLLVRQGARVVYLPDCRAMLLDPLIYLQTALIFAFLNSAIHLEDIQMRGCRITGRILRSIQVDWSAIFHRGSVECSGPRADGRRRGTR